MTKMVNPICILKAVSFIDLFAVGLILPLIMIQARKLGASHIEIGLLGSIYAGFQLGSGPMIGSLSDLKGRKPILIISLLLSGVTYTAMGLVPTVYAILLLRALLGLFKQTQMLTRAMVPDYEKSEKKQGEIFGKMNAVSGVGMTLGPVVGGHIAEDYPLYGFSLVAVAVGFCFLLNAGLVFILPSPKGKHRRTDNSANLNTTTNLVKMFSDSIKQSFKALRSIDWSLYGDIFMFKGLIGFAMGVYYSNYPTFLRETFSLNPKNVGYIISFQGVIGSITSYCIGYINSFYINDKDYSHRNFHVFVLLTVALVGLIFASNAYLYTFWLIPLAIGNAVGRLITLEMALNRSQGGHRGKLIGASNSVRSLSGVISPMIAGFIGQWFGVGYVIFASLLATVIGLLLSYNQKQEILKDD